MLAPQRTQQAEVQLEDVMFPRVVRTYSERMLECVDQVFANCYSISLKRVLLALLGKLREYSQKSL